MATIKIHLQDSSGELMNLRTNQRDALLLIGQYPKRFRKEDTLDKIKQTIPHLSLQETFVPFHPKLADVADSTQVEKAINTFLIPTQLVFKVEIDLTNNPHLDRQINFVISENDLVVDEDMSVLPTNGKSLASLTNTMLQALNDLHINEHKNVYEEMVKLLY